MCTFLTRLNLLRLMECDAQIRRSNTEEKLLRDNGCLWPSNCLLRLLASFAIVRWPNIVPSQTNTSQSTAFQFQRLGGFLSARERSRKSERRPKPPWIHNEATVSHHLVHKMR